MPTRRRRRQAEDQNRLSDADVAARSERFETLKAEIAKLDKEVKKIQREILDEMKAREVESIDFGDGRVTRTAAKNVAVSIDVLRELLPTRVFKRVTTVQVDKTLLSAAVQERLIAPEVVAAASSVTENAPYIRISHGTGD